MARTAGNEILTSAAALVLTVLLAAEGLTLLSLGSLRSPHMFIGLLLVPPVLLKMGSTGYRFARYYTGSRMYREKGPPHIGLRLLAPVLVATTVVVLASGVALMAVGHRTDPLFTIHKVSFIVWAGVFGVHFLAHLPRMLRSLTRDWTAAARRRVPGAGARAGAVLASVGMGVAAAMALLTTITGWHGERLR